MDLKRTLILAEIANAHAGSEASALALVEAASVAGADAVKFQCFSADELVVPKHPRHAHFSKLQFAKDAWHRVISQARAGGLGVFSDVFGEASAALMNALSVDAFKIHASDTTNLPLLRFVASCGRPVLLGCGGATLLEIREAVDCLRNSGCPDVVLMHGFQAFPTSLNETHLSRISTLRSQLGLRVGLMDHAPGDSEWAQLTPLMGIALGACIIEKHIVLNRAEKGIDHHSALEPVEFSELVRKIRTAESVMGQTTTWGPQESRYRLQMKKQLVAIRDLPAGTTLLDGDVSYLRCESAVAPLRLKHVIGRTTRRELSAHTPLTMNDVVVRVAVLVVARMHSTRLPRKALIPIAGQPALLHLIQRARLSQCASEVIVCTSTHPDDQAIADLAERAGVKCFRGSENDVLHRMIEASRSADCEIVVRVTGDDILIDPVYLDRAVEWHRSRNADYTTISGIPSGTECEVFSLSALETAHRLAVDPTQTEYLSWYMQRPDLFELANLSADPDDLRSYRLTLDTAEDLEVLTRTLEAVYDRSRSYTLRELITWLDAHPEVRSLNSQAKPKLTRDMINTRFVGD
jgi:N,N'-diacetyllegionaminate synthase